MNFNLNELLSVCLELVELEASFSREEIDGVIFQLPRNKSPSLDGFNNEFIKSWWSIIANDFYNLIVNFQQGGVCIRSINASFITLIPNTDGANKVNDFKPISLLNTSLKVITKLLANRLQKVIPKLITQKPIWFH